MNFDACRCRLVTLGPNVCVLVLLVAGLLCQGCYRRTELRNTGLLSRFSLVSEVSGSTEGGRLIVELREDLSEVESIARDEFPRCGAIRADYGSWFLGDEAVTFYEGRWKSGHLLHSPGWTTAIIYRKAGTK